MDVFKFEWNVDKLISLMLNSDSSLPTKIIECWARRFDQRVSRFIGGKKRMILFFILYRNQLLDSSLMNFDSDRNLFVLDSGQSSSWEVVLDDGFFSRFDWINDDVNDQHTDTVFSMSFVERRGRGFVQSTFLSSVNDSSLICKWSVFVRSSLILQGWIISFESNVSIDRYRVKTIVA